MIPINKSKMHNIRGSEMSFLHLHIKQKNVFLARGGTWGIRLKSCGIACIYGDTCTPSTSDQVWHKFDSLLIGYS